MMNSIDDPSPKRQPTDTARPGTRKTGGGELLKTRHEMAELAGFSVRTLDRLTAAKMIPVLRLGNRMVRYQPDKVLAALEKNLEQKSA